MATFTSKRQGFLEVGDGLVETFVQFDLWCPVRKRFHQGYVGSALGGVVFGKRCFYKSRGGSSLLKNFFGQLPNGEFRWIAQVDWPNGVFLFHYPDHALHQVVDVAKGAGLGAIAVKGDVFSLEGLHDEVRNNSPVVRAHPGAIGVENSNDANIHTVFSMVVEKKSFRTSLPLVVAGSGANRVYVPSVGFRLRVYVRVSVYFRGGSLQDTSLHSFGQTQAIDGSHDRSFRRLDGIVLVMNGRSRASEVEDSVDLRLERIHYVVPKEFKSPLFQQVFHIASTPREEVVQAEYVMALVEQTLAKVTAKEACASGN